MLDIPGNEIFKAYHNLAVNGKERPKKPASKQRKASLDALTETINSWSYVTSNPTRNEIVYRLTKYLNANDFKAKVGCIPSILVQEKFPIEVIRHYTDRDIVELFGRMVWINDLYDSCIGILVGLDNPETVKELEETFPKIFESAESVFLVLV